MENIFIVIFVLHLLHNFATVSPFPKSSTESFLIHYLENRRIIPVRIEINAITQTEYVTSVAGETLYDFNLGKVAYKDLNSSQCFITDIVEESIEKDRKRLKNLQNGIIKGFYLPTFIIQSEINNTSTFTENFGILLSEFCKGNAISLVVKQRHRRKRDTSDDRGQFTHHSYGHYGHQSNNYAHYGHETYIKGTVDENGRIQNQQVNHQQVRSESSHAYPRPAQRNGQQDFSRMDAGTAQRPTYTNGQRDFRRASADVPRTQYQTQHRIPSYQQTFGNGEKIPTNGGTGQFSLQSTHEGGYQLSLPLGLQAANIYRGGVRSGGHYGVGGLQPQIRTEHQQYPDTTLPAGYQRFDQRQPVPVPPVDRPSYPSSLQRPYNGDTRKIPSRIQPGAFIPAVSAPEDRRVLPPTGIKTPESHIPALGHRRQPDADYESQRARQLEPGTVPSAHGTPSADDRPALTHTLTHPPSSIPPDMRFQVTGQQPGLSTPSIHMPSGTIHSPAGIPGQTSVKIPISGISDRSVTSASRPSQIHGVYPDLVPQQQYIPGGLVPGQQHFQTPDVRQTTGFRTNGDIQRRLVPPSLTPDTYPSFPSARDTGKEQITQVSYPGSPSIPSLSQTHEATRNGARYPDTSRPQAAFKDEYPSSGIYPGISGTPTDTSSTFGARTQPEGISSIPTRHDSTSPEAVRGQVPTVSRPGETIQDSRYNLSIPSRGTVSELSVPTDRRTISGQNGYRTSRTYAQDSASSQTQIQTGYEGTAAEASAAGNYGGLGSQTQVQGGFVGNGSFSAQAQSGFTGGVVQSQVQGGKQGGLSGSSAQVQRVGSAQSQVQVLQPSGSASSTAQGRFTGGTTQVQAQSSKTGGSAGAQAQSTGLSSSHVQVNIGGNDVNKNESFQGTVSASVQGGQLSGQSQTQLQGGYDSGRTYAATAQGGFDTASTFQAAIPPIGSLTLGGQQFSATGGQQFPDALRQDQRQISGVPFSRDSTGITQQALMPSTAQTNYSRTPYPRSQIDDSRVSYPSSEQSGLLPSSIYRETYPSYPTEVRDGRVHPISSGATPGYRRLDERGVVIPSYPQTGIPGITEEQTRFGVQGPETQSRTLQEPVSPRETYPSLPAHTLTDRTDQYYVSRTPSSYPHVPAFHHPSQPTFDSRYMPGFPSMTQHPDLTQQPGIQSIYPPSSHFPDQTRILTPSSQTVPSHRRPGEMPILTRPDGSLPGEPTSRYLPTPDQTKIQPQQQQFLFPSSQIPGLPRPQIPLQYPSITAPRTPAQPEPSLISQPRPQIRPEQSQIPSQIPQISTTTERAPTVVQTETPSRVPGVSEPDTRDCCAALRDLKRRCCGGTSKKDGTSPCCRSSSDDIFDFSSEDDLDENKEPCKIVKAICYIVYKPVGKARVCKPTATNGC